MIDGAVEIAERVGAFLLCGFGGGEVVPGIGDLGVILAERFDLAVQSLAIELFRLRVSLLHQEDHGEIADGKLCFGMVRAEHAAAECESFALECFRFLQLVFSHKRVGEIAESEQHIRMFVAQDAATDFEPAPLQVLSFCIPAEPVIGVGKILHRAECVGMIRTERAQSTMV